MIQIYNSFSRQKEALKPINPGKVNMYVCGMTVYDYCHIGHARGVFVTFDMIVRYLRARGYEVNYVRNITDIDDKIINRAKELGISIEALTDKYITAMNEDIAALNVLPVSAEPKATEHIAAIIDLIKVLIDKGYAYQASNGDVNFRVRHFKNYGELTHKNIDDLRSGARVEISDAKEDPLDFVLWKKSKPHEPKWDSPWGEGRPGWHIECSAMSMQLLGQHFDIHGGGFDLQFPHHENEIAQSEAATGEKFVNIWMHVGFVTINKEKMSKSLGNFFTIREVLAEFPAEVVRYFMLSSHYRSPINYSKENLEFAYGALERLYTALRGLKPAEPPTDTAFENKFYAVMDDDFNTPEAFAVLFDIAREINRQKLISLSTAAQLGALLRKLGNLLGILYCEADAFLRSGITDAEQQHIELLIAKRNAARAEKNWAQADQVRTELASLGVTLEDSANGTTWRKS